MESRITKYLNKLALLKKADFSGINNANERIQLFNKLVCYVDRNFNKLVINEHNRELYTNLKWVSIDNDIFVVGNCWRIPDQHVELVHRTRSLISRLDPLLQ